MWLNIIAVIVLVLFFSYFLKIKTNVSYENEKKIDKIEEEKLPSSVNQARYEESRYAFLKFAEFVLLKKRPFGFISELPGDDDVKGRISGGNLRGEQEGVTSYDNCKSICLDDPLCNAWQYDTDQKCNKYKINSSTNIIQEEGSANNIGYIFRPSDSNWAVQDLSGLPISAEFFKAVANTVLTLNCKIEKLRNKASQVISTSNIRYCYETEVSSDGASAAYISARKEAISSLEHATKFFIFSGENDFSGEPDIFPKQKECSLYFSKIVDSMTNSDTTDGNLLFADDENWLNAVSQASADLLEHYDAFTLVRDFFVSSLDKNYNSSIDKSELKAVYKQAIKSGQNFSMAVLKDTANDGEAVDNIDALYNAIDDNCMDDNAINNLVNAFFLNYDSNEDELVYLDELLQQVPKREYPEGMCST